jgi:hypothetical protein
MLPGIKTDCYLIGSDGVRQGWPGSSQELDHTKSRHPRSLLADHPRDHRKSVELARLPRWRRISDSRTGVGAKHSIGNPIHIYPLYENGFRAHRNQFIKDNHAESAKLYAEFAQVADKNPFSWNYGSPAETEKSISTVEKRNRMICLPCSSIPS